MNFIHWANDIDGRANTQCPTGVQTLNALKVKVLTSQELKLRRGNIETDKIISKACFEYGVEVQEGTSLGSIEELSPVLKAARESKSEKEQEQVDKEDGK